MKLKADNHLALYLFKCLAFLRSYKHHFRDSSNCLHILCSHSHWLKCFVFSECCWVFRPSYCRARRLTTRWRVRLAIRCTPVKRLRSSWRLVLLRLSCWSTTVTSLSSLTRKCVQEISISHRRNASTVSRLTSEATLVVSVALLVARRTNNRKVVGSRPANVVCVTVLTGNRLG